jgi:osmotically-inducible protein OsmY
MNTIREKVEDALSGDPRTQDAAIEVLNENGVVTLGGTVPERETSTAAESIAEQVDGVVSVVNEIQVRNVDEDEDDPFGVTGTLDEDIIVK